MFKDAVDADWELSREYRITGVPTFVAGRDGVVSARPYEALEDVLRVPGGRGRIGSYKAPPGATDRGGKPASSTAEDAKREQPEIGQGAGEKATLKKPLSADDVQVGDHIRTAKGHAGKVILKSKDGKKIPVPGRGRPEAHVPRLSA